MSNTNESFYVHTHFWNFTVISMEFPITNCLPFFFQTDGKFYQIILSHTLGRCPNKSPIKKLMSLKIKKVFDRTKVYYCFNSKGDNFDVNKL